MNKFLLAGVIATLLAGTYTLTYKLGSHSGADFVQSQWDADKAKQLAAVAKLEEEYAALEAVHSKKVKELSSELETSAKEYQDALAQFERDYSARLQQSQTRAAIYQRQAQGSSAERDHLAEHAAKLDSSLEEGRHLVRELRETVEQRDRTIRSLGIMLQTDRQLFNVE